MQNSFSIELMPVGMNEFSKGINSAIMKGDRGMANLQVRDMVFCRFIGTESNLLEVFNAIRKTGYTDASKVMITTLAGSFYSNIKNDISFIMELDNNNHSVFLLYYHLVLVVKYRRKVFSDQMSQYTKDIFCPYCFIV